MYTHTDLRARISGFPSPRVSFWASPGRPFSVMMLSLSAQWGDRRRTQSLQRAELKWLCCPDWDCRPSPPSGCAAAAGTRSVCPTLEERGCFEPVFSISDERCSSRPSVPECSGRRHYKLALLPPRHELFPSPLNPHVLRPPRTDSTSSSLSARTGSSFLHSQADIAIYRGDITTTRSGIAAFWTYIILNATPNLPYLLFCT